jgi:8-oxo-dGTP pyrophosphatase MutT (NUDIX family)
VRPTPDKKLVFKSSLIFPTSTLTSFPGGGVNIVRLYGHNTSFGRELIRKHTVQNESPLAAALRETEEELGIPRTSIELLGTVTPPVRSIGGKCVWPFVVRSRSAPFIRSRVARKLMVAFEKGWIHPTEPADAQAQQPSAPPRCYDSVSTPCTVCRPRELALENHSRSDYLKPTDAPLRSLNLSALSTCKREVRNVFHLRLPSLSETVPPRTLKTNSADAPSRNLALRTSLFRSVPSKPYYVVNRVALGCDVDEDATRAEREIWGLTGWYLNLFMRTMGWWGEPPSEDG